MSSFKAWWKFGWFQVLMVIISWLAFFLIMNNEVLADQAGKMMVVFGILFSGIVFLILLLTPFDISPLPMFAFLAGVLSGEAIISGGFLAVVSISMSGLLISWIIFFVNVNKCFQEIPIKQEVVWVSYYLEFFLIFIPIVVVLG